MAHWYQRFARGRWQPADSSLIMHSVIAKRSTLMSAKWCFLFHMNVCARTSHLSLCVLVLLMLFLLVTHIQVLSSARGATHLREGCLFSCMQHTPFTQLFSCYLTHTHRSLVAPEEPHSMGLRSASKAALKPSTTQAPPSVADGESKGSLFPICPGRS